MTSSADDGWFAGLKEHLRERERRHDAPSISPRRYEILGKIGEGAAAQVFRARDRDLGRTVALKILRDPLATSAAVLERFQREGQTAASLSHPNLVTVYDSAIEEGRPYLVMELVEGISLADLLDRKSEPVEALVRMLEKVARGVAAAHAQGVVHRDLKPGNILVGHDGEPKVADFGLAHVTGAEVRLTRTGVAIGTPLYMAPEQVQGRSSQIGLPTDVYALGVILYEMLIGRPPHAGDSVTEVYGRILHEDPVAPRRLNPRLPVDLETIALKALDKDPARRYPSAREFADDLRRFLGGEPIQARPPGLVTMGRKLVRRHRLPLAIAAAVVVASVAWAAVDLARRNRDARVQSLLESAEPALTAATQAPYRAVADWPALFAEVGRARPAIEEARRLAPRSPLVQFRLGLSWSAVGEDAKAEACWREAIRLDPEFGPAHFQLGRSILARAIVGTTGRTLAEVRRNRATAQALGAEAGREFEKAGKTPGGRDPELQRAVAEAVAAYGRNDLKATCALAEEGLRRFPGGDGREMFHLMLALASPADRSRAMIEEAVKAAPQDYLMRAVRAVRRQEAGDATGAESDYDAALAGRPGFAALHLNRSILRAGRGESAGALADLDAYLGIAGDTAETLTIRGDLRFAAGDLKGARADYDRALELDPLSTTARFGRAEVKRNEKDDAGALADYDAVILADPASAAAWCNRAAVKRRLKRYEEAIADATEAIRLEPSLGEAWVNRGNACFWAERWAEADRDYTKSEELKPPSRDVLYGRAVSRAKLGRYAEALVDGERALKDAPRDWSLRQTLEQRMEFWRKR